MGKPWKKVCRKGCNGEGRSKRCECGDGFSDGTCNVTSGATRRSTGRPLSGTGHELRVWMTARDAVDRVCAQISHLTHFNRGWSMPMIMTGTSFDEAKAKGIFGSKYDDEYSDHCRNHRLGDLLRDCVKKSNIYHGVPV